MPAVHVAKHNGVRADAGRRIEGVQGANCVEVCMHKFCLVAIQGSTAQFGKKSQTGFLPQFKVWKTKESCMYFWFFKLKKWGKKTAETRRRNCAVLP